MKNILLILVTFSTLEYESYAMKSIFLILVTFSTLEYESYDISGSLEEKNVFFRCSINP